MRSARGEGLDAAQLGDAFYDQSHLIREIKRFAGATPGQLGSPTLYTEATTKGRKQLAGKLQNSYGITKDEAEDQIDSFVNQYRDEDDASMRNVGSRH